MFSPFPITQMFMLMFFDVIHSGAFFIYRKFRGISYIIKKAAAETATANRQIFQQDL